MAGWQPEPHIRGEREGFKSDSMFVYTVGRGWTLIPDVRDSDPIHPLTSDILSLAPGDADIERMQSRVRTIARRPGGLNYLNGQMWPGRFPHHSSDPYQAYNPATAPRLRDHSRPHNLSRDAARRAPWNWHLTDPLVALGRVMARYRHIPLTRTVTMRELFTWALLEPELAYALIMETEIGADTALRLRLEAEEERVMGVADYRLSGAGVPREWIDSWRHARGD